MKIQAINAPFRIELSSNSYRLPETFYWSNQEEEIKVFIDMGLMRGANYVKNNKKFGWFCESRIVRENVYLDIKNNLHKYKNSYNKIFTCDQDLLNIDSDLFVFAFAGSNLPWTPPEEYGVHSKTKLVSLLASPNTSTEGHKNRIRMAEKFKNSVDLYGGIFNSQKIGVSGQEHYHHKKKTEALKDYMFSITIENCKYDTYFTEKITDCFANGVVPIYYGTDKIFDYFDKDGIIILDDKFNISNLTTELYESKKQAIHNNYLKIKSLVGSDDYLVQKIKEFV
jgi:hypothetical protein